MSTIVKATAWRSVRRIELAVVAALVLPAVVASSEPRCLTPALGPIALGSAGTATPLAWDIRRAGEHLGGI